MSNLLFDHVVVVEQPFSGGRDWLVLPYCLRELAVSLIKVPVTCSKAREQRTSDARVDGDLVPLRSLDCMDLEFMQVQQLASDRIRDARCSLRATSQGDNAQHQSNQYRSRKVWQDV
jgi:hypothetical protein